MFDVLACVGRMISSEVDDLSKLPPNTSGKLHGHIVEGRERCHEKPRTSGWSMQQVQKRVTYIWLRGVSLVGLEERAIDVGRETGDWTERRAICRPRALTAAYGDFVVDIV